MEDPEESSSDDENCYYSKNADMQLSTELNAQFSNIFESKMNKMVEIKSISANNSLNLIKQLIKQQAGNNNRT